MVQNYPLPMVTEHFLSNNCVQVKFVVDVLSCLLPQIHLILIIFVAQLISKRILLRWFRLLLEC